MMKTKSIVLLTVVFALYVNRGFAQEVRSSVGTAVGVPPGMTAAKTYEWDELQSDIRLHSGPLRILGPVMLAAGLAVSASEEPKAGEVISPGAVLCCAGALTTVINEIKLRRMKTRARLMVGFLPPSGAPALSERSRLALRDSPALMLTLNF